MAPAADHPGHQARIARLLVVLVVAACANVEPPPGGPPDAEPPMILSVEPESGAVVRGFKEHALIRFDEVIEEMPGGGLDALVLLSPVAGRVQVEWRRTAIAVRPREDWKPDRVYRLELLPGVSDLRRNRLSSGLTVVFTTGAPVPHAAITGTALHWVEQRPLRQALIQAARRPDTIPYLELADSAGNFQLGGIPPGEYVVYAVQDQNTNRRREPTEAYDSTVVRVDTSAAVALWAFVHDTIGPRLRQADVADSLTVRVQLTQPLDPNQRLDTSRIHVFALPDTTPVTVESVLTAAAYDSLRAREQAAADSARRAAGDTAGRPRAPGRQAPPAPPRAPPPGQPGRPGVQAPRGLPGDSARAAARAADSTRLHALLSSRRVPTDRLVVRTARPLAPDSHYLLRATDLRGLTGATVSSQQLFVTPKPPPPPPPPRVPAPAAPGARDTVPQRAP